MTVPFIIESSGRGERAYDVYSRLFEDRIIMLGEAVEDYSANAIVAQMLLLDAKNPELPIQFYINSPGGVISAGLAIYDTMQYLNAPVNTICIGEACSMAAILLTAGTGKRYALPNSRIMIHQPSAGAFGKVTDMEISLKEAVRYKKVLTEILHKHTKQPIAKLEGDQERDFFLSAEEAIKYGLIDAIAARAVKVE